MKRLLKISIVFLIVLTTSVRLSNAQSGSRWYYNIDENNLAASGYDVVGYHTDNKAVAGFDSIQSVYKSVVYQFATEVNKATFDKDPESYLPAFGGWCTYIMGINEASGFPPTRFKSDPENFKIINDKLYFFAKNPRQDFKQIFEARDQEAILARANKFWESRVTYGEMYDGLPPGLNPMARMENLDWVPFLGQWDADAGWWLDTAGVNKSSFKGDWTIAYGYNGYGVEDDFMSTPLSYAGTPEGPAVRGYDVVNKEWHMTYIPLNQPRSATMLMTGKFVGAGHLIGQMETKDPNGNKILQKIVFKIKTKDSFEWSAHWSWDNGKTWKENTGLVISTRVK